MSIFSRDNSKTVIQRLDAVTDRLKSAGIGNESEFVTAVNAIKKQPDACVIKPDDLCVDIIELIISNPINSPSKYYQILCQAEKVYQAIFIYDEATSDFEKLRMIFLEMYREKNVIDNKLFDLKLYDSFNDKEKYLLLCRALISNPNSSAVFAVIKDYGIQIREYMIDDDMYLGNLIKVATKLSNAVPEQMADIIKAEIENVMRMNGIYNVDPVKIAKVDQNIREASRIIENGEDVIRQVDEKSDYIAKLADDFASQAKEIRQSEEVKLEQKLKSATERLDKVLEEYAENQKKVLLMEKDILIKQVYAEAEAELTNYKAMAKTIAASTSMEIANLNRNAESVLTRVSNFVNNDSQVKKALENAEVNQALMEKINKLNMLNDVNIETMQKHMEATMAAPHAAPAQTPAAAAIQAAPAMTTDMSMEIPPINPLLDPNIPFKSRWDIVMKDKKRMEEQGAHFHETFDDVLMAIMEDANPYLIGPSGCGKTFMIKQIAKLLKMDFIDIGYINEEYDILGFQTATGAYSTPNFYRCYKYGIIAFCDELDNGNSRATVKLNSFLSNNLDSSYNFPNGECVTRHPNFRIVAAGNTEGNGADANYNTREKIEESVQQRFLPVYVGYDNAVEKNILIDYPDWFSFVVLFRKATDRWSEVNGIAAQGILTTRDTNRIKRYLDNKSFSPDKILKYEFIQTKDAEYLMFIKDEIKKHEQEFAKAAPIINLFNKQVDSICRKGMRS